MGPSAGARRLPRGLRPGRPEDALQDLAGGPPGGRPASRRYAHIGTGNYNPKTARLYEDLGLFTADERICADLTDLFNVLTGYSRQTEYRSLLVAPHGVRAGLIERIEREIEHARAGRPAHIQIKTNHLVDEQTIDALYRASQAGVRVDLLVRTFCTIRSGVPGLSENITHPLDPGPLPGALAGLLLRQRRRARVLDRLGRPDAPQPRPPGRGAVPRSPTSTAQTHIRDCWTWPSPRDRGLGAAARRPLGAHRRQPIDYQELLMKRLADRGE